MNAIARKTNFGCNFKYVFILVSRYYVASRTYFYLDVEFPAVNVGNSSKHTAFYLGLTCISSQGGPHVLFHLLSVI